MQSLVKEKDFHIEELRRSLKLAAEDIARPTPPGSSDTKPTVQKPGLRHLAPSHHLSQDFSTLSKPVLTSYSPINTKNAGNHSLQSKLYP